MPGRRRSRGLSDTTGPLNLTPLLDVIFMLLFFFVLATQIRDRERFVEMELPESVFAEPGAAASPLPRISVNADGKVRLNGDLVGDEELAAGLRILVQQDNVTEIVLDSDGNAPWQRIVSITDICREAGIVRVTPRVEQPVGGDAAP